MSLFMKDESKIIKQINNKLFLAILLLLTTFVAVAQKNMIKNIDSLRFQLNKTSTDTTKILILYETQ